VTIKQAFRARHLKFFHTEFLAGGNYIHNLVINFHANGRSSGLRLKTTNIFDFEKKFLTILHHFTGSPPKYPLRQDKSRQTGQKSSLTNFCCSRFQKFLPEKSLIPGH